MRRRTELKEILEARQIMANGENIISQAWETCQTLFPRLDYLKENQTKEAAE